MEAGSLVVPRPVAWMMKFYPKKFTLERKKDSSQLDPVIVMPNEIAVPKEHATEVERWLLSHGIRLPIPEGWDVKKKMKPKKCNSKICLLCEA